MDEEQKKYRQYLVETEQKLSDSYDKTVVTLAGGALGISFAFLKDVIGADPARVRWALMAGWGLLTGSLAAVVLSLFFSTLAYRHAIKQHDKMEEAGSLVEGWTATATLWLHMAAVVLLVFGLLSLGLFVYRNV